MYKISTDPLLEPSEDLFRFCGFSFVPPWETFHWKQIKQTKTKREKMCILKVEIKSGNGGSGMYRQIEDFSGRGNGNETNWQSVHPLKPYRVKCKSTVTSRFILLVCWHFDKCITLTFCWQLAPNGLRVSGPNTPQTGPGEQVAPFHTCY